MPCHPHKIFLFVVALLLKYYLSIQTSRARRITITTFFSLILDDLTVVIPFTTTDHKDDDNGNGNGGEMLRNPQAQGRSQSFRHRPVPRVTGGTSGAQTTSSTARTTPAATTADTSQERRRSTPTITRRCSLQNRARVESRIDAWPEPKQRSEAEERFLALPDACDYTRVRQFNIDAKGAVIARGDSFRRKRQQHVVHAQRSNPIATVGDHSVGAGGTATTATASDQSPPTVGELAERPASAGAPLSSSLHHYAASARSATSSSTSSSSSGSDGGRVGGTVVADVVATAHDVTRRRSPSTAPASGGDDGDGAPHIEVEGEAASAVGSCSASILRICVLGQSGAGKSALIRRFISSDYRNVFADELLEEANCETQNCSVSINIGGHECDLCFTECTDLHQMEAEEEGKQRRQHTFHAYLLVYSIDRKASFRVALRALEELREAHCPAPIILVGNKMDLERRRTVMENEVKHVMHTYDVPHFQISVALNHDVDDLLVGIVAQIKEAFQMDIGGGGGVGGGAANGGENISPSPRGASKDGAGGFDSEDFHAAIRRFSRRKKRQMGLAEPDMDTGKCTNLFDKLRRWRRGTANL